MCMIAQLMTFWGEFYKYEYKKDGKPLRNAETLFWLQLLPTVLCDILRKLQKHPRPG